MKLGTLLNEVVTKSGGDVNDQAFIALLSKPEVNGAEVPDTLATKIQENLFTLESAKNNSILKSHFTTTTLNGVDAAIENDAKELGLSETDIAEIKAEKNTFRKSKLFAEKAKAVEAKKYEGKTGKEAEIIKQNNELNEKLAATIKAAGEREAVLLSSHQTELLNYEIANHLGTYQYALPKEMPAEVKVKTAQALLNQELLTKGLKVTKVDGVLKLLKSDGTEYFDAKHQKVEFPNFAKLILDTNKLLEVSKTPDQNGKTPVIITGNENKKANPSMVSSIDESLADIAASNGQAN